MFERVMRDDDIGPAVLDLLKRVENGDAVPACGRRRRLVDLDTEPLLDVETGQNIAAAASEIDHTIRRADEGFELQAIEIGRVALVFEGFVEIGLVVVGILFGDGGRCIGNSHDLPLRRNRTG